jgi:hypothetical protein
MPANSTEMDSNTRPLSDDILLDETKEQINNGLEGGTIAS